MIRIETWQGTPVYTMGNDDLEVSLCPSLGNNLYRIYDKQKGREVLRVPESPQELRDQPGQFGTPLMLPPNRIKHATFQYEGRTYHFDKNHEQKHHMHGFLRDRPWTVTEFTETEDEIVLTSSFAASDFPEVIRQFPHQLIVETTYILKGKNLNQKVVIRNLGDEPAPVGFGLHTWFMIDGEPEKWTLTVPASNTWEFDNELIPTGKLLPLVDESNFNEGLNLSGRNINTAFYVDDDKSHTAVLARDDVELRYTSSIDYKQWVIYTRGEAGQFIGLEPYTWITDAPNLDLDPKITGLQAVRPGKPLELLVDLEIIHKK